MDFDDLDDGFEGEEVAETTEDVEMGSIGLLILATYERLDFPVKITDTVLTVRKQLADIYGLDLEIVRLGVEMGRHIEYHDDDDIAFSVRESRFVCVKGIYSFQNKKINYPHPYLIIGGGHYGCRQAVEYKRKKVDYELFERKDGFGGNAWHTIANEQSRLQSEGCHYQIQFDPFDGGADLIWSNEKFCGDENDTVGRLNHWPSKAAILRNYQTIMDEYKVPYHLSTEITKMNIIEVENPKDEVEAVLQKKYDMEWKSTKPGDDTEGVFTCSNMCVYPGAMCHPRRHVFPGEEDFGEGTMIGYGYSNEFNYAGIKGKHGILVGMGAFGAENVRTLLEYRAAKVNLICRHFNLMLPRMCSWQMQMSMTPPSAAQLLETMDAMYKMVDLDPWTWWSVSSNKERTNATIKQYTRWGIGDVYFCALYFGQCVVTNTEIKRLKNRKVLLKNDTEIDDIDFLVKVLGFLSDFSCDKLMQCSRMVGQWPEGDWRRFILSDQSEIDANNFSSVGFSSGGCAMVRMSLWYHQHPQDAIGLLSSGMLKENFAEPDQGLTAYHYHPRNGTSNMILIMSFCPSFGDFGAENDVFKVEMYRKYAPQDEWLESVKADWEKYCDICKEIGFTIEPPPYPYTAEYLENLGDKAEESADAFKAKMEKKYGKAKRWLTESGAQLGNC